MREIIYEKLDDLKRIKKEYGENMAHLCRELFPTILEKPGLLYYIISSHFAKSRLLYDDIINGSKKYDFKNYIYSIYDDIVDLEIGQKSNKTVRELLAEKGYTLYECKTNEDIQKFKKYYARGEELCTFSDSSRINNHYIFFIVKDNVDEIKREDFPYPEREDKYSTSVLDLQFDKGPKQRVSIKSRYNHRVKWPDATYSNNLENIAKGLTDAFERDYGFNIGNEYKANFVLDGYILASDDKYYKFNYEINNIHYCPNNIIIKDGKVIDTYADTRRYIVLDYFIIDKLEKTIKVYDSSIEDSFIKGLDNITNIKEINEGGFRTIIISQEGGREAIIKIDNLGRIIKYENKYLKECGDRFLLWNNSIQELNLPQLERCGDLFLYDNNSVLELNLPKLKKCGARFLYSNNSLEVLNLPQLKKCGDEFLCGGYTLKELILPQLEECGDKFLYFNMSLHDLNLPNLKKCGNGFFYKNRIIQRVALPKLESCGEEFLNDNNSLLELSLPQLKSCKGDFLFENKVLKVVSLPQLQSCGSCFLYKNNSVQELRLQRLETCGNSFLHSNNCILVLDLPQLKTCGGSFLHMNKSLLVLDLPQLESCGDAFLYLNNSLYELRLPKIRECGMYFLYWNNSLEELELLQLESCGDNFLHENKVISRLNTPKLSCRGKGFVGDRFEFNSEGVIKR